MQVHDQGKTTQSFSGNVVQFLEGHLEEMLRVTRLGLKEQSHLNCLPSKTWGFG